MDFCKFYGIAATKLAMMTISNNELDEYVSYMNNKVDVRILQDFKYELEYLNRFLTKVVTVEYTSPAHRKLSMRVNRNMTARATGMPLSDRFKMTDEELEEAKKVLETADCSLSSVITLDNGDNIALSDAQICIIEYFRGRQNVIDRYASRVVTKSFTEKLVFDRKLKRVVEGSGWGIKNSVMTNIALASKNEAALKSLYDRYNEDLELMKSFIVEPKTSEELALMEKKAKEAALLKKRNEDISKGLISIHSKPDYASTLSDEDWDKFNKILSTCPQIYSNEVLRKVAYQIFNRIKDIDVNFYNIKFGLNLTKEQYEKEFEGLSKLGLVGLDFYTLDFFKLFLNNATFASEIQIELYEPKHTDLIKSIKQIERLLDTKMELGSPLKDKESEYEIDNVDIELDGDVDLEGDL